MKIRLDKIKNMYIYTKNLIYIHIYVLFTMKIFKVVLQYIFIKSILLSTILDLKCNFLLKTLRKSCTKKV